MTEEIPVFHQHVVVDLVELEWKAISNLHGEMTLRKKKKKKIELDSLKL